MKVLKARLYDLKMKEQQAQAESDQRRQEGHRLRHQIRSYVLAPYQHGEGPPHQGAGRRPRPRARRRHRSVHQVVSDEEVERDAGRAGSRTKMSKRAPRSHRRDRVLRRSCVPGGGRHPADAADRPRSGSACSRTISVSAPKPTRSAPRSAFPTSCRICSARARCRRRSFPSTRRSSRAASGATPTAWRGAVASLLALAVGVIVLAGVLATPFLIDLIAPGLRRRTARRSRFGSCASCFPAPGCWCCPRGASACSTATAAFCSRTPRR